jgi:hypothetical protein
VTNNSHDPKKTNEARNEMESNHQLSIPQGPGTAACPRFRTDISGKDALFNVKQKGAGK